MEVIPVLANSIQLGEIICLIAYKFGIIKSHFLLFWSNFCGIFPFLYGSHSCSCKFNTIWGNNMFILIQIRDNQISFFLLFRSNFCGIPHFCMEVDSCPCKFNTIWGNNMFILIQIRDNQISFSAVSE